MSTESFVARRRTLCVSCLVFSLWVSLFQLRLNYKYWDKVATRHNIKKLTIELESAIPKFCTSHARVCLKVAFETEIASWVSEGHPTCSRETWVAFETARAAWHSFFMSPKKVFGTTCNFNTGATWVQEMALLFPSLDESLYNTEWKSIHKFAHCRIYFGILLLVECITEFNWSNNTPEFSSPASASTSISCSEVTWSPLFWGSVQ